MFGWFKRWQELRRLNRVLFGKDYWATKSAFSAIAGLGTAGALRILLLASQHKPSPPVGSVELEEALRANCDSPKGQENLRRLLRDRDAVIRCQVISRLNWYLLPAGDADRLLRRALRDQSAPVRCAAAKQVGRRGGPLALDWLLVALRDRDADVRRAAGEALGTLGDKNAVEPLIKLLSDRDRWSRWTAACSLGRLLDVRAFHPLLLATLDPDEYIRRDARGTIDKFRAALGVEPLVTALGSDNPHARLAAAMRLVALNDLRGADLLFAGYKDENLDDWLRTECIDELARHGDIRALPYALDRKGAGWRTKSLLRVVPILSRNASLVPKEELCQLAVTEDDVETQYHREKDFSTYPPYETIEWTTEERTSLESVRKLAREELARRGHPA